MVKKQKYKTNILWFVCGLMIYSGGCGGPKGIDVAKIETRMIHSGDIDIAYKTFGKGYPLILIMGYSGTMNFWDPVVLGELVSNYEVIIFDNRGMGSTGASDKEFTIEQFADDTAGLMDALKIKKAHVLGWSMGTNIAIEFAIKYPDKVHKLILYAADCGGKEAIQPSPDVIEMMRLTDTAGNPGEMAEKLVKLLFPEKWLRENPALWKYYSAAAIHDIPTERSRKQNIERQFKAMEIWQGAYTRLPQLTRPTLLITGTDDVITPPQNSQILAAHIPGARLLQIKGGGHGLIYQYPKRFSQAVLTFLKD
jgi:pimeloyl-ACP methyl ester carboxylesterase